MKRTIFIVLAIVATVAIWTGCTKNSMWVGNVEYIIGEYSNPNGTPSFKVTEATHFVTYNKNSVFARANGDGVTLGVDGIRVANDDYNYVIEKIEIGECDQEKCSSSDYVTQNEFSSGESSVKTHIVAVLVIDMSKSLGDNIKNVKEYAKTMAQKITAITDSSYVGIVFFSKNVDTLGFYNKANINKINEYIDNYTNNENLTTLYGACQKGLDMLNQTSLKGDKNLIIFTDGGDNNTNNPTTVKSVIMKSTITRFAIGVEGSDFQEDPLRDLATKKGTFFVAKDFEDLQDAFDKVSQQVATIYRVEYNRSAQQLDKLTIKFKFTVDKSK